MYDVTADSYNNVTTWYYISVNNDDAVVIGTDIETFKTDIVDELPTVWSHRRRACRRALRRYVY